LFREPANGLRMHLEEGRRLHEGEGSERISHSHLVSLHAGAPLSDPRETIAIGRVKGPPSPLNVLANPATTFLHEPLNASSVLPFMVRYAVESGLPDPGLKEAFVLDFLTAVAAAMCLVGIVAPHRSRAWGRAGEVCFAAKGLFWTADNDRCAPDSTFGEPFTTTFKPMLDEMAVPFDYRETRSLFNRLNETYYATLAVTGMDRQEMVGFIGLSLRRMLPGERSPG
jgi:hypothetical protein